VIKTSSNSEVQVTNRDSQGMVPEVVSKGDNLIIEGSKSLEVRNSKIYLKTENSLAGSSSAPLELNVVDETNPNKRESVILISQPNKISITAKKSSGNALEDQPRVTLNNKSRELFDNIFGRLMGRFKARQEYINAHSGNFVAGVKG